jgi:hypothetical protein
MADQPSEPKVRWDDGRAKRSHANECALSASKTQFVVSFGIAGAPQTGQDRGVVEVIQRVAMTPRVAKQLAVLLDRVLREYESRHGSGQPPPSPGRKGDSVGPL